MVRVQDQLIQIQIIYAYHTDTRLMICIFFPVSQSERVYDTHIYTHLIWYTRIINLYKGVPGS
jgi:hypothetical protein